MPYSPFKTLVFAGLLCLVLSNCGTEPKTLSETTGKDKNDSLPALADSADAGNDELSFTLPSPLQVATIFKKSGLAYKPGITNPASNAIRYNTSNYRRCVALGIYSSDLAYTMLNRQFQESKTYLKACKDLGSQLGLGSAFESNKLAERFDKNIGNEDSLIRLISDIQMQTDILLEENHQKHVTAIAFAGAWVESLYIAAKVKSSEKYKNTGMMLLEQYNVADKISKALKACEQKEPGCRELGEGIQAIIGAFNNCPTLKSVHDANDEVDYSTMNVSEEEFNAIAAKVMEVRAKLVN